MNMKAPQKFQKALEGIVASTIPLIEETLSRITIPQDLLRFMYLYACHFNGPSAPGIAGLVSQFSGAGNYFQKPREIGFNTASTRVAVEIYHSLGDEYVDPKLRDNHRDLAQQCYEGMHRRLLPGKKIHANPPSPSIRQTVGKMNAFYQQPRRTAKDFFTALGYHYGSENTAALEFVNISRYLKKQWPDLVRKMEMGKSYQWIPLHIDAEARHARHAWGAVTKAFEYYRGPVSTLALQNAVYKGAEMFVRHQTEFFGNALQKNR